MPRTKRSDTSTLTSANVESDTRKALYIICPSCDRRIYLGPWGAAHVGIDELRAECTTCGHHITIERDEPAHAE